MIYRTETYIDDKNKSVIAKIPTVTSTEAKISFIGTTIKITEKGVIPVSFPFPDTYLNLESCFNDFDTVMENFINEKRKEAKTKIVTPNELIK